MAIFSEKHFVEVKAGLGNQFYMFAYADYLQRKGKKVWLYKYSNEVGDTKDRTKRNLNLEIPQKMGFIFQDILPKYPKYGRKYATIIRLWQKYFYEERIEPAKEWAVFHTVDSVKFKDYTHHIGYYQSYHYVTDDFRRKLSNIVDSMCSNQSKYDIDSNDVALHIRRGDIMSEDVAYYVIGASYYIKALEALKTKINIRNIFIFSDDFEAIKPEIEEISKVAKVVLVEGQSVLEDMNTLRLFSNYVLGNSTFAWWGAMLSVNETPNVYVPKEPWKVEMPNKSPYFPSWVQLENV